MTSTDDMVQRLRPILLGPLESFRKQLARSNVAARCAVLLRNQMDGIVFLHLGHDVDHATNGETLLLDRIAPQGMTFVDIGANAGDWTALFLERCPPNAKGLLFDPSSSANRRLVERFKASPGVTVLRAAVSDTSGPVTFHEEENVGTTSSLVAGFSNASAKAVTVQSLTLDEALAAQGMPRVDYLKIDAEGYDLHVLRGARESLREQRIRFLQFEYNDAWRGAGSKLKGALDLLDDAGYAVFLLKGPGLYELPYAVYQEYYHYSNFAAFPRDRLGELGELVRGEI